MAIHSSRGEFERGGGREEEEEEGFAVDGNNLCGFYRIWTFCRAIFYVSFIFRSNSFISCSFIIPGSPFILSFSRIYCVCT